MKPLGNKLETFNSILRKYANGPYKYPKAVGICYLVGRPIFFSN